VIQEARLIVSGSVQGVGFRAAVRRHALEHNLKGFVRNLPDGRVEICIQGSDDQIVSFTRVLKANPGRGSISFIDSSLQPPNNLYHSFDIC
jgi:acylphosphatase